MVVSRGGTAQADCRKRSWGGLDFVLRIQSPRMYVQTNPGEGRPEVACEATRRERERCD